MYNLIEYSENYSKASGSLWQYCNDIPTVDDDSSIVNFKELMLLFNFKAQITGQSGNDRTRKVETMVLL